MRSATVFFALAAAFASAADDKKSPLEEFNIVAGNVELRERGAWCIGERNTCETLCPGTPQENSCDIDTLEYSCTCKNGTEPGLRYYDSSLYSHVCQEAFKQCSNTNAGDPVELPKCKDDIQSKCGTLSISDFDESDDDGDDDDDSSSTSASQSSAPSETEDSSSGNEEEDSDEGDDDSGIGALRPALGTAGVAAAIGAAAFFF